MKINHQKIGTLNCVLASQTDHPKSVVILCHGFGAPGQDLVTIADEMMEFGGAISETMFLFPAAPMELDPSYDGRAWWMIDVERMQYLMAIGQTREMRHVDPPELVDCNQRIVEIIEWTKIQFGIRAKQIVVGGFSQGAMLVTDVALRYREPLGGLIIWSGALICESKWREAASQQGSLKVIQSHGRQDLILSLAGGRDLQELLTAAGHQVNFHEFNGAHTIPMHALKLAVELITECVESAT